MLLIIRIFHQGPLPPPQKNLINTSSIFILWNTIKLLSILILGIFSNEVILVFSQYKAPFVIKLNKKKLKNHLHWGGIKKKHQSLANLSLMSNYQCSSNCWCEISVSLQRFNTWKGSKENARAKIILLSIEYKYVNFGWTWSIIPRSIIRIDVMYGLTS